MKQTKTAVKPDPATQAEFDAQIVYDKDITIILTRPNGKISKYDRRYTVKECHCGCGEQLIPKLVRATGSGHVKKDFLQVQPEGNHSFSKRRYKNKKHANVSRGKLLPNQRVESNICVQWLYRPVVSL